MLASEVEKTQQSHRWLRGGDVYSAMIQRMMINRDSGWKLCLLTNHVECLLRANELCHALDFNTGNISEMLPSP